MKAEKQKIRIHYKKIIKNLSSKRKSLAADHLDRHLHKITNSFSNILSFAPLPFEIDITKTNNRLAQENKLYLPRIFGDELQIYKVDNPFSQLIKNPTLSFFEPDSKKCFQLLDLQVLDLALIPAVAFDIHRNRLGFGMGFYDRFLEKIITCYTIGLGYIEQFSPLALPNEKHDKMLSKIILV